MSLGFGGIDSKINAKADAFRNNPQQLKKRYAQNKELVDLLALQKITTEKKQTAMNMVLAAESNPNTIRDQREQEALELTKQEMQTTLGALTNRTKGTLDTETAKKKAAVNKLTSAAAKGGLGALTGARRPAPQINPSEGIATRSTQGAPVRRLAQGGIVGFAGEDGNNQVGSAFSRFFNRNPPGTTVSEEEATRRDLLRAVRDKYGANANLEGIFAPQSDQQRAYANEVMNQTGLRSTLSNEKLQELLDAPFTSSMINADVSALPELPVKEVVAPIETDADLSVPETADLNAPRTATYSYPSTSQNPVKELDNLDLLPVVPTASDPADTTSYDTAVTSMRTAATQQADTDIMDQDAPTFTEATAVAAPLDEQGHIDRKALLQMYRDDMAVDVGGAEVSARTAADAHLRRAENAQDFRDMRTAEQDLQYRTLDPNQLAKEARIRTLGGARRGRGGMSDAYGQVMADQRKDLSGGLATLRGIDEKRISGDLSTAQTSSARGSEAAGRASTRRLGGITGLQSDILAQEKRALAAQEQRNTQNTAVYNHESAVKQATFKSAESVIQRNYSAAQSIVASERSFLKTQNAAIKQFDADTAAAYRVQTEQKAKVAVERAKIILEQNNEALDSLVEVEKLVALQERELDKLVGGLVQDDPAWKKASLALAEMVDGENDPEYKAQVKVARAAYNRYYMQIADLFPNLIGDLSALKELTKAIRSRTGLPVPYAQETDIVNVVPQSNNIVPDGPYNP
tara:strand:- start:1548 stop:3788 length:2241 start_codon:yes stop_codon:yes gene_type:complete